MLKFKLILIIFFGVVQLFAQQFGDKQHYLIDSLLVSEINAQDKKILDSILPQYHQSKSDTQKLSLINKITELCIDDNVWPKYNQLLYDESREVLSNPMLSKKEKNFVKRSVAAAINNFGYLAYTLGKPEDAIKYYKESLSYYQSALDKDGMATCFNNIAAIYDDQGNQVEALKYYQKSLHFVEQIADKQGIALALNNIGYIYNDQGQISQALEYYRKCVSILEQINDRQTLAITLNNIGYIYKMQEQHDKCLEYYLRSLEIFEEIGDKQGIAGMYNNLGIVYNKDKSTYDKALEYYKKSLEIEQEIGHQKGEADALNNIGVVYERKKNYNQALEYYEKSLAIRQQLNEKEGIASSLLSIGRLKFNTGLVNEGIEYGEKSLEYAQEISSPYNIQNAAEFLHTVYDKKNDIVNAYKMYQLHIQMRDSILNEKNKKAAIKDDIQYQFQKQALKDSLERIEVQRIKDLEHLQELEKKQAYVYMGLGGALLMLLVVFAVLRGYQQKKKSNVLLAEKNALIEQKNIEITDSINYAQRIQEAIIPSLEEINIHLKNCFVMYRPKDIVAGDFYWIQPIDDKILYAAADCTGHGVPGAMVSVVCHNALNRAVREYKLADPAKILDKTREIVIETFQKQEEKERMLKDGMDIALCLIDQKNSTIQYAGANNSLYIVRNQELIEIKPDKQPVGKYWEMKSFTNHSFDLLLGDTIYTFTDGYPDQFGGPKGKKFMYKQFKQMLIDVSDKPISKQKGIIEKRFDDWKGDIEQIDDVCVIGVKI